MKLIDLLKSPYWARIHEEIWTKLKQRGILEVDVSDMPDVKEIYEEMTKDGIHIAKESYLEMVGISKTAAHLHGFYKKT